jgi:AcrR family transcriptional regulator
MKLASRYHHGNLRMELLAAARVRLAQSGHAALSLRGLAAEIGVAPSAPYGHFKSREELLAVLVAEGSADLVARFEVAAASAASPLQRLELACLAYVSFAQGNPELFSLMFVVAIDWEAGLKTQVAQSRLAYPIFEKLVAATMAGAIGLDINAATLAVWSAIHGMAMLKLNGRLERRYVAGQTDLNLIRTILKYEGSEPTGPSGKGADMAKP